MFCPKCGLQNVDNAQFCSSCRTPLNMGASAGGGPTPGLQTNLNSGTQTGMQKNVAGLLCYLFGWLSGIIFYFIEKDRFVRFHAVQSIVVSGAITILQILFSILSPILWRLFLVFTALNTLLWIGLVILMIICMVKAYKGEMYKLPFAGNIAEKFSR